MFGQIIVGKLFRERNFLTQMCGNNFMVLKVAPPLVVTEEQIEAFIFAVRHVMEEVHSSASFWLDALHLAKRAVKI
jgi:ornithine--oxo-acid transaminase